MTDSTEEFILSLVEKLTKLKYHDFVASEQSRHFKNVKENLKIGEFLVTLDFSENYAFVVQEAVQGFHWNNNQATVHPFVIYYRDINSNDIEHLSYVGISDCLEHDTVAVFMFQKKMIQFLKEKFTTVEKIIYFSDGAPQQYKNKKNFSNLRHHYDDFSVQAEWNYFASAHGKGACDGVGGTLKRIARRYSLQKGTRNEILTAKQLYEWSVSHLKNYNVFFCSTFDYEVASEYLKLRHEKCKTVKGTLSFHHVSPMSENTIAFKTTSTSLKSLQVKM